jgi:hypothetical protein
MLAAMSTPARRFKRDPVSQRHSLAGRAIAERSRANTADVVRNAGAMGATSAAAARVWLSLTSCMESARDGQMDACRADEQPKEMTALEALATRSRSHEGQAWAARASKPSASNPSQRGGGVLRAGQRHTPTRPLGCYTAPFPGYLLWPLISRLLTPRSGLPSTAFPLQHLRPRPPPELHLHLDLDHLTSSVPPDLLLSPFIHSL